MRDVVSHAKHALNAVVFLSEDPRPIYASLFAIRAVYPQQWTPREAEFPPAPVGESPRWRAGFVLVMLRASLRNWLRPVPADAWA